jgi:hypothetical protein
VDAENVNDETGPIAQGEGPAPDAGAPAGPPDELAGLPRPEERRRRSGITGRRMILPDGTEWLLADAGIAPVLTELRDKIHDDRTLGGGKVLVEDLEIAGFYLLTQNYDLTPQEAFRILAAATTEELVTEVGEALFSPTAPAIYTYTDWVEGALLANGLDPARLPPEKVAIVLRHLVGTGRALPIEKFVSADEASAYRSNLFATLS